MAATREMVAAYFFGGDAEAARCLYEGNRDSVAVHVPGGAKQNPLLSIDWMPHIGTLLDNHDIGPFEFDVILNGVAAQTRDLLDAKSQPSAEAIDKALRQGATLRLYGVSRFEPRCAAQLQLLRRVLNREAFVNLYLTPARCPGLKLHFDLEDSLVVQVKGEKLWRLYQASDGPRYPRAHPVGPPAVQSEPSQIVHMRTGDVLFVPSGLAHLVETRDSASQHVTFGVSVSRQVDMLSGLLDQFAATQDELRRPIRGDEQVPPEQLEEWVRRFQLWLGESARQG
ncbi:MAG: cupin domain-containing protein [Hyphomonadaceae bacterium]